MVINPFSKTGFIKYIHSISMIDYIDHIPGIHKESQRWWIDHGPFNIFPSRNSTLPSQLRRDVVRGERCCAGAIRAMRDLCANDTDARWVFGVSKCWNDGLCGWIHCVQFQWEKSVFWRDVYLLPWPVDHLSVKKNLARSIMRFHDIWVCLIE